MALYRFCREGVVSSAPGSLQPAPALTRTMLGGAQVPLSAVVHWLQSRSGYSFAPAPQAETGKVRYTVVVDLTAQRGTQNQASVKPVHRLHLAPLLSEPL